VKQITSRKLLQTIKMTIKSSRITKIAIISYFQKAVFEAKKIYCIFKEYYFT